MPETTSTAPSSTQTSASRLVSLPSLYNSLCSLPSATSTCGLPLHPSSFSQNPSQNEAKLELALNKNLTAAKQRQQEEHEKRLKEMRDVARLRMLEQQKDQQQLVSY
ncbi:hypothetical protein AN958_06382 [Leucoagaricus sp. SymC.cos]|nr:hypothetical protein AN958_06382 [Leucoagaricus sp. SymC.cos]